LVSVDYYIIQILFAENKMTRESAADAHGQMQCITFELNHETYGINVMQVQEVLREIEVAPVPGAPHYVIGIINLRGNVVSVIDARTRFGLPSIERTGMSRIIVIEAHKQIIGILVDSVAEVVDVKLNEIETAPNVGNDESSRYIDGVVSWDDKLLILVDLDKLLSEAEWGDISNI
jgi:purine-binding chemotaxis protein CheW